jgi:hypothetical protein
VTEVVCEIKEVSVTSVVKDGDGDNESEDDGEELSYNEADGKEDCVSDILTCADTDDEAQDDCDKLAIAESETDTVLHAVIESL